MMSVSGARKPKVKAEPSLRSYVVDFQGECSLTVWARDKAHAREVAIEESEKAANGRALRNALYESMEITGVSDGDA